MKRVLQYSILTLFNVAGEDEFSNLLEQDLELISEVIYRIEEEEKEE